MSRLPDDRDSGGNRYRRNPRRARHSEVRSPLAGTDRWMIPYADLATLLLTLFVVLFVAVKSENAGRAVATLAPSPDPDPTDPSPALVQLVGETEAEPAKAPNEVPTPPASDRTPSVSENAAAESRDDGTSRSSIEERIARFAANTGAESQLLTRSEERGFVVSLVEAGFFDIGQEAPRPEALPVIDVLGGLLAESSNQIRIEGHTDDRPIRTDRYPSNWELSTARATWLVGYLVRRFGIQPDRLSAAGYGEFRPIASNDSPEGRSRNRRVDVVLLSSEFVAAEEPIVLSSRGLTQ